MQKDEIKPDDKASLSEERKKHIEQEEIFREEIRSQIEGQKQPHTLFGKAKQFVNTSFGIWLLSTVVDGLFTWGYSGWSSTRESERQTIKRIEMLDTEISGRLRYMDEMFKSDVSPILYLAFTMGGSMGGTSGSGSDNNSSAGSGGTQMQQPGVFPDFRNRTITSLIWELKGLVPKSDRRQLDVALAQGEKLNLFNINLIQEFMKSGLDMDGDKPQNLDTVADLKDTVGYLLSIPRWQTESHVDPDVLAQIKKNQDDQDAKRKKRL